MDVVVGYLLQSLKANNLIDKVNMLVLSDHGMTNAVNPPILVQNYIDLSLVNMNKSIFNYVSNIFPSSNDNLTALYNAMHKLPNTTVYYKKDIPKEYHYINSDRIGDILAVSDEGYYLTNDPKFKGENGYHGYNNTLKTMRASFMGKYF
jgi:ectonucleotide pyrophosphatase/phosphodiesterase family protein 5